MKSSASSSNHSSVHKNNSNPLKQPEANASNKDRKGSLSDCSTTSNSSRKNSEVSIIPEEKPEQKVKEPQDIPTKRAKRKQQDTSSRLNTKSYQEPQEPKIVTEEISDPWEKQKIRHDHDDDKQKRSKRSKASHKKDSTHPGLEKKNSNGSSAGDEYEAHADEKPLGFTTIENSKPKLKKNNSLPASAFSHTMDKLDEISLNGPKPDGKDYPKKTTKAEYNKTNNHNSEGKHQRTKKTPFHQEKERLMMDTPTSPHAIAAAIFDAALVKKSQQKKKNGKKTSSSKSKRPDSSSSDLSASSRSSSYSSIPNEGKERARSATPSGSVQQGKAVISCPFTDNIPPVPELYHK